MHGNRRDTRGVVLSVRGYRRRCASESVIRSPLRMGQRQRLPDKATVPVNNVFDGAGRNNSRGAVNEGEDAAEDRCQPPAAKGSIRLLCNCPLAEVAPTD